MRRIIIDIDDDNLEDDDFLPFALAIDTIVNTAFRQGFVRSGNAGDEHLTDASAYPDGVPTT